VPAGQTVLCLPYEHSDVFWRAVIIIREVNGIELARLTWVHPECVVPLALHRDEVTPTVRIEKTKGRGDAPSVLVPRSHPGIKWTKDVFHTSYSAPESAGPRGRLLLDARWDFRSYGTTPQCSGYCLALCMNIIMDPQILAVVIRFAELSLGERQSYVCCAHAKHRSVAVGVMLKVLMRFNIDFSEATRDRSDTCCGEPTMANIPAVLARLRDVPVLHAPSSTLAATLQLKGWRSAFWGDHRRYVPV
jgi:hypothetical protein